MTYQDFIQQGFDLHGYVNFNSGGQKIGTYRLAHNKFTNHAQYQLFYSNGRRANLKFGISKKRAFELLMNGQLSLNAENSKIENYV